MSMRIDNNLSTMKTQDMAADKAKDIKNQSLNPQALEQEEKLLRDEELKKTQAMEETEFTRIDPNKQNQQGQQGEQENREEEAAVLTISEDARRLGLAEQAASQYLELAVDKGKFIQPEEHKIDLRL